MPNEPLTREELKALIKEAMAESFVSVGMDPQDRISLQKDMAFIRSARLSRERMTFKMAAVIMGVVITTGIGFLVAGLTGQHPGN